MTEIKDLLKAYDAVSADRERLTQIGHKYEETNRKRETDLALLATEKAHYEAECDALVKNTTTSNFETQRAEYSMRVAKIADVEERIGKLRQEQTLAQGPHQALWTHMTTTKAQEEALKPIQSLRLAVVPFYERALRAVKVGDQVWRLKVENGTYRAQMDAVTGLVLDVSDGSWTVGFKSGQVIEPVPNYWRVYTTTGVMQRRICMWPFLSDMDVPVQRRLLAAMIDLPVLFMD